MKDKKGNLWLFLCLALVAVMLTSAMAEEPAGPVDGSTEDARYVSDGMSQKMKDSIGAALADPAHAEMTKAAIKPDEEPGFLGIPGAPVPNFIIGILWAVWVGWIFSTVGAFGGIMAGVGHITIFGLGDYAKSFGKGNPVNKLLTDSIRVSNQWLVGLAALISSTNYYRMGRLVLPLGLCLAIGGMAGSYLVPLATAGQVSLKAYLGYFGIIVFIIGIKLFYDTTSRARAKKSAAKEAAANFEAKRKEGGAEVEQGVKLVEMTYTRLFISAGIVLLGVLVGNLFKDLHWGVSVGLIAVGAALMPMKRIKFTWFGSEFSFSPLLPGIGGFFIAMIASFLGIGGGFLYVPFLTAAAGLPMFLVAGTSAVAVCVGMIISILSFMVAKGVVVHWGLIGAELIGIFVGAMIGPRTSKYIPDIWLKRLFVVLAAYVGLRYFSKGFFGTSWVPPF